MISGIIFSILLSFILLICGNCFTLIFFFHYIDKAWKDHDEVEVDKYHGINDNIDVKTNDDVTLVMTMVISYCVSSLVGQLPWCTMSMRQAQ